jgi:hypothetical protein
MISAMYENGGNTTHRFLDGHPQLFVYPFESQPGTNYVSDYLQSVFPVKYRWGEFPLEGTFENDYEAIIDEELKRHAKTPFASKFKEAKMNFDDKNRKKIFLQLLKGKERTRKNILEAFFVATFEAWQDYNRSGKEKYYVGYSPIIGVDADKILSDFPTAHIIHIVRNPYSAFAETKRRPVPYSAKRYAETWSIMQYYAMTFAKKYPDNFHLVRFEDLVENPKKFFTSLCKKLDITYDKALEYRSWNGRQLENTVPWGTIQTPTPEANKATMEELSKKEYDDVKKYTQAINSLLGYEKL